MRSLHPLAFGLVAFASPALALAQASLPAEARQPAGSAEVEDVDTTVEELVVTASGRPRGAVIGDITPEVQFDAREIRALGVSTIEELLEVLAPQITSGRGRGGGAPVVLLNGQRISGFREIRGLPPEAIIRVDILPEEVALKYGYRADQRVVNIVLRERFRAVTAEVEGGAPTQGGRASSELDLSALRIRDGGRWNVEAEHERSSSILERERDISRPEDAVADERPYRTLSPDSEALSLNAVLNRVLFEDVSATMNLGFDQTETESLLGLFDGRSDGPAVQRESRTRSGQANVGLNGDVGADWRWTFTGGYGQTRTRTLTDREGFLYAARDEASSTEHTLNAALVLNGSPLELPAGELGTTFRLGADSQRFDSRSSTQFGVSEAELSRDRVSAQGNVDAPLTRRRDGAPAGVGDVTLNVNAEVEQYSDFGLLRVLGGGVNWSPVEPLDLIASITDEDGAPTVQQLGDPVTTTPGALVFDFSTGRTVEVLRVDGGNPDLIADNRRVLKLGLTLKPWEERDLALTANWIRTRINDPISSFPSLTPEIEAAFPERFERNAAGDLIRIDARPVNYARSDTEELRWGFNYSRRLGPAGPGERGPAPGPPPGGPPPGAGPGRGFGGPGGRFGGGRPGEGRLQLAMYHTWNLRNEILIRDGVPPLDLLNGSATGSRGGEPEHELELQAGLFKGGLGARLEANWRSGTFIRGDESGRPDAVGDLRFSDQTTVDLRLFADFGQRRSLVQRYPWLRGSRLSLSVDNVFDERLDVRDASGVTPRGYEADLLDPEGRTFRISFRKLFLPPGLRADQQRRGERSGG
jgi:iron complex outermembrane recepter protein